LRLTLLYGGVFLASGAVLLGVAYFLVRQTTSGTIYSVKQTVGGAVVNGPRGAIGLGPIPLGAAPLAVEHRSGRPEALSEPKSGHATLRVVRAAPAAPRAGEGSGVSVAGGAARVRAAPLFFAGKGGPLPGRPLTIKQAESQAHQLQALASQQHGNELHQILLDLGIALGIMAVVSMGLGWLVAGRALRPLQTITRAARAISADSLHKRLSLRGPNDELRELGETFDELLGRLERSFEAQRQFVANASHELRTPLTLERAILDVTLADRTASNESLRTACERVLAIGEQQERMIECLLTLARSERGLERREPFELQALTCEALIAHGREIARRGLEVESDLRIAWTTGDPRLAERLVDNLIANGVQHNVDGGRLRVATGLDCDRATIAVSNSGPVVREQDVERLFVPFQRLGTARSSRGDRHGLGLSIVSAIAAAHGARVRARSRRDGGLDVEVGFAMAHVSSLQSRSAIEDLSEEPVLGALS
jgi:signal transduction histidine kinase